MDGEPRNLVWAESVGLLRDVEIRDCRILGRHWGWAKSKFRSLSVSVRATTLYAPREGAC